MMAYVMNILDERVGCVDHQLRLMRPIEVFCAHGPSQTHDSTARFRFGQLLSTGSFGALVGNDVCRALMIV